MSGSLLDHPGGESRRILVVSSFFPPHLGGQEYYAAWMHRYLVGRGHVVRRLSVDHAGSPAEVCVKHRPLTASAWPLVMPSRDVLRRIDAEVVWSDVVLIQNFAHPLCTYAGVLAHRRKRPALTFIHTAQPPSYGTATYRTVARVYDETASRLLFRSSTAVATSDSSERFWTARFGGRCEHLPWPVPALPGRDSPPPPGPAEPFRVVFAARLAPDKGPLDAVHACDALPFALRLDVYGDGRERVALERLAQTRPWIRLHGARSWLEVNQAKAAAHAFLSASNMDNVQSSLLEALCMGVPSVGTSIGDTHAYYPGPFRRLVAEPRNPSQLARGLTLIRDDYAVWQQRFTQRRRDLLVRHDQRAVERGLDALIAEATRCGPLDSNSSRGSTACV